MDQQKEKRVRATSHKREIDMCLMNDMGEFHLKLNNKMDNAKNMHEEVLAEKRREIQRENDIFKEKVQKYQTEREETKR
jgi:hypothetical protein